MVLAWFSTLPRVMPSVASSGIAALQLALPAVVAAALALFLRRARTPGGPHAAAAVAGVVAGLLLGPGIFGRAFPAMHEKIYVGGTAESRALADLRVRQRADLAALRAAGVTPVAIDEAARAHVEERRPAEAKLAEARAAHRAALDRLAAAVVVLAGFLSGVAAAPRAARLVAPARDLAAGAAAAAMAAIPPLVIARFGIAWPWTDSAAIALAFAVPALAPARAAAFTFGGLGAAGAAALAVYPSPRLAAALAAAPIGALMMHALPRRAGRPVRRAGAAILVALVAPLLVALASLRPDPHALVADVRFWMLAVLAALWAGDGRWFTAWFAARFIGGQRGRRDGRAWSHAARAVAPGTGAAMAAVALLLAPSVAGQDAADILLAVAAMGALVVELTRGLRTWVARMLDGGLAAR